MDIRHLRYFVALWDERSFTNAARKVHVAQSTLSHQIRQLESEVGQQLFLRNEQGVIGTPAGEVFYVNACQTLEAFDQGIAAMKSIPRKLSGSIRLGVTPTINIDLIPQAVATFVKHNAGVKVIVSESSSSEVADSVLHQRLDVGIAYAPTPVIKGLDFEPLFDDELVVVVNDEHPLARRKRLRMLDLHNMEFVLQPKTCATRQLLDLAFATAGAVPSIVVEFESLPAIKSLVRRTMIAAIMSRLAVRDNTRLVAIPIEGPTPLRVPGLITSDKNRSFNLSSFCATIRSVVSERNLPGVRR